MHDSGSFLGLVASTYFNVTTTAIRRHDANHMILGSRLLGPSPTVIQAMSPYTDLIDVHCYESTPCDAMLSKLHNISPLFFFLPAE